MREEIGSEFWSVPTANHKNTIFPLNTKWFISGRAALSFIIQDILAANKISNVALPSWCCESMIIPFLNEGIEVSFYPISVLDGKLFSDCSALSAEAVLVMDYFGYHFGTILPAEYDGIVIRDLTHSLFRKKESDSFDYAFGSLRKWAGFWTGGFAISSKWNISVPIETADEKYVSIRAKAMGKKIDYLHGKTDSKDYLSEFSEGEAFLDTYPIQTAVQRDINCAEFFDAIAVRESRRKNAAILLEGIRNLALFPVISDDDCPLFVPILVPDGKRDALRKYLINNEIYCPIHWPVSKYHKLDKAEQYLYENELSLVCDQRYTEEDMHRMVDTINRFWKDG